MALRDSTAVNVGANGGTVSAPAGLAQNDIVLLRVLLAGYNNLAITWPAGFTQIGNTSCDASVAADVRTHKVAWARMGASPPANFAVSWTGNDASTIHCAAFSGRSTTSDPAAFETQPGAGTTSRPLSLAATGGTMVAGDDVAWFADVFGGGDAGTFTPPTDYTAQETSTNLYAIGQLATRDNVASGSTTPITGSWTGPAAQAYSWGTIVVRIPAASSAPTISAGTPTGTVGANTTVGFTSTASTGTARIVIDTAANLDTVTNTQVAAGQKENGTAAAYDSGNITVTDTTPEFAFTGLTSGTWTACAVHDGSTVLSWTFTVDSSPSAFSFTDQTDVAVSSVRTSNSITVTGLGGTTPVSITGGEYRKNGGSWVTAAGTVVNTDTIEVRHTASALYNTVTNTVLTIGDSSDTFTSTTLAITLSSPTASSGTTSTASGTVSTTVATGTIYTVASTSATAPTGAQIEAGDMHTGADAAGAASPLTVTAAGSQNLSLSGLPQGTTLYLHSVHKVGSQYSNIATSAAFTTRGIGSVDGDNIVVEGQTGVIVAGRFGSTTPVARIKSGSFSATQTVTANSTSSITVSPIARGSLPYTDANHTHLLEIDTDE